MRRARALLGALGAVVACAVTCGDARLPTNPVRRVQARTLQPPTGVDPILAELLVPRPEWITRLMSSHDPMGGNRDNACEGMPLEGDWRVLFHAKGEGRITRLWMTADPQTDIPNDWQEIRIETDGRTVY